MWEPEAGLVAMEVCGWGNVNAVVEVGSEGEVVEGSEGEVVEGSEGEVVEGFLVVRSPSVTGENEIR